MSCPERVARCSLCSHLLLLARYMGLGVRLCIVILHAVCGRWYYSFPGPSSHQQLPISHTILCEFNHECGQWTPLQCQSHNSVHVILAYMYGWPAWLINAALRYREETSFFACSLYHKLLLLCLCEWLQASPHWLCRMVLLWCLSEEEEENEGQRLRGELAI